MKGGSRYGAGRPAHHAKTSHTPSLDIRRLHREGHLQHQTTLSWRWSNGATANVCVTAQALTLHYRFRHRDDEWHTVEQRVALVHTDCHFGGLRPWFQCPRCYRKTTTIYLRGWPACRLCQRLVYPVQAEDRLARNWRKTHRLAQQLGSENADWHYRRPKGMRRTTFERLSGRYFDLEQQRDDMLDGYMARMGLSLK